MSLPIVEMGDGLKVSKIGYGAMGITAFYGPPMEDEDALKLLKGVIDLGVSHIDTAEIYRTGNPFGENEKHTKFNETIVGKFVQSIDRKSVTVATKYFPGIHGGKCDQKTVAAAVDASLSRLGLEYIDLYYCHRMPASLEALEEWMRSCKALVSEGKIKHLGLSECPPSYLRAAHKIHPVSVVQQEWSLLTRYPVEEVLVPVCKELGVGIVAYSPLARNLLNSDLKEVPKDFRSRLPRYSEENFQKNIDLAKKIAQIGESLNATSVQLSLAWLYARAEKMGVKMVAIPGSTKIKNVTSNVESLKIKLTDDHIKTLEKLAANVVGNRADKNYVENAMEGYLKK